MKLRNLQAVLLATSGLLLTASPAAWAVDAAISGVVRDSSGSPQMDVLVQLLRADSTIIQAVRTDERGRYTIAGVMPGLYQLKAIETSFLPTLRENLRVTSRGRTEANLTLSTLLEALQWLPAQKRNTTEPEDDWTWTLRSTAYRPLLRFVGEDGLETVETVEPPARQHHGRFLIESGARAFGQSNAAETVEFDNSSSKGADRFVRARLADGASGTNALVAGYRTENSVGSGLSTVVAYQQDRGMRGGAASGLTALRVRSTDTIRLMPDLTAIVGNQLDMLGLGSSRITQFSPYAMVAWTHGDASVSYAVTTAPVLRDASGVEPLIALEAGSAAMEHGLHQEVKVARSTDLYTASFAVYEDRIDNPVVDGLGSTGDTELTREGLLADAGMVRATGSNYSSRGAVLRVSRKGPASTRASVELGSGKALALADERAAQAGAPAPVFKPVSSGTVALMLEGASLHGGTNWRGSYRWEPGSTVNAVDLFDTRLADAYLSLFLKQSLHLSRIFPGGVDAIVDVRNLLAQGYHPFLAKDGSTIFFAQVNRSVQGGLAFYF